MRDLAGKIAVLTGAGAGIGRALAQRLVQQGCHIAICDVRPEKLEQTRSLCESNNPHNVVVACYECDVADEHQVAGFQDFVEGTLGRDHIHLLINNAAVNGGGSFIRSDKAEWERTFNIGWNGVYLMTRAFMPMLFNSEEGHIVNMSSANAIRAVLGGHVPHTAYSSAKFAIRGFSESLIHDFRFNAPHLSVSVVMPGHTGTEILSNSQEVLGQNEPENWNARDIETAKARWQIAGHPLSSHISDDEVRETGRREVEQMRDLGMPPDEVASIILEGVRQKQWRIIIGDDTHSLDQLVRESPDTAYDEDFVHRWRAKTHEMFPPK